MCFRKNIIFIFFIYAFVFSLSMKAQGYREQIFKKNKIKAVYEFNCDSSGNESQLLRKSFINQNGYASGSVTYKSGSNDTVFKTAFFYDYLNRMICVVNISKESWDSTIITYKTPNNYETVYKDENFTRRHITKRRKILNREITKSYKNDSLTNWKITIRG
jgi:ribosomal protein S18